MQKQENRPNITGKVIMTVFFIILCILFLIPLYALLLGTFNISVERKTTLYRFEGNRVSGEYVLTDVLVLTDEQKTALNALADKLIEGV